MHIIARVGAARHHQKIILNSFKVVEAHGAALQSACQLPPFSPPLARRSLFPSDIQLNQSGI